MAPENLQLIERWSAWRGERLLPRRSEIDLGSIKHILPDVSLIEVRSPDEAVFRVAGSSFRDFAGFEVTGHNYIALLEPRRREAVASTIQLVVGRPVGVLYSMRHRFPSGAVIPIEVMSLPIEADKPGGARLILSSNILLMSRREEPEAAPDRRLPHPGTYDFIDIGAGIPASSAVM
jgi:hypothetical protein